MADKLKYMHWKKILLVGGILMVALVLGFCVQKLEIIDVNKLPSLNETIKIANTYLEHEKKEWYKNPEYFFPPSSYLGKPILIRDMAGKEKYWVVPVLDNEKVIGIFTISASYEVDTIARFEIPRSNYPEITLSEAKNIIKNVAKKKYNQISISEPVYIVSKVGEVWMASIYKDNKEISKMFLNPHCSKEEGYILYEQVGEEIKLVLNTCDKE